MTTTQEVVILLGPLCVLLMAALLFLLLRRSPSLTTPSPTPTSTPPTPSDPVITMMMKTMEMMEKEATENRRLVEILTLGRPPESLAPTETSSTSSIEQPGVYDPDSTPLSLGIEAILDREREEDEQLRLMRERAALQEKLRATTLEWQRLTDQSASEDSSPGPWSVPEAESGSPM